MGWSAHLGFAPPAYPLHGGGGQEDHARFRFSRFRRRARLRRLGQRQAHQKLEVRSQKPEKKPRKEYPLIFFWFLTSGFLLLVSGLSALRCRWRGSACRSVPWPYAERF